MLGPRRGPEGAALARQRRTKNQERARSTPGLGSKLGSRSLRWRTLAACSEAPRLPISTRLWCASRAIGVAC
eukprot:scaffold57264_cov29-Tisochrysis_lutea.AAC.1